MYQYKIMFSLMAITTVKIVQDSDIYFIIYLDLKNYKINELYMFQ